MNHPYDEAAASVARLFGNEPSSGISFGCKNCRNEHSDDCTYSEHQKPPYTVKCGRYEPR